LYLEYLKTQKEITQEKIILLSGIKKEYQDSVSKLAKEIKENTNSSEKERAELLLFATNSRSKIRKRRDDGRRMVYQNFKNLSWLEWLRSEAEKGRPDALEVLRTRLKSGNIRDKNQIIWRRKYLFSNRQDLKSLQQIKVSLSGAVEYGINGKVLFIDKGDRLVVLSRGGAAIKLAIEFAYGKYSQELEFKGDESFVQKASEFYGKEFFLNSGKSIAI